MSSNNLIDLTPKEIKSNYNKKYYNSTKENNKYNERKKIIKCVICPGSYCYYNKSRHFKNRRHIRELEKLKNICSDY
jgi:hypothetical protein